MEAFGCAVDVFLRWAVLDASTAALTGSGTSQS